MYLIEHNKSIFTNYNEVRALLYCFDEQSHKFIENTCLLVSSSEHNAMLVTDVYKELKTLKRSYYQSRYYLKQLEHYKLATIVSDKVFLSPILFSNKGLIINFESEQLTVSKGIHNITIDCSFERYLCFLRNTLTKRTLTYSLFKLILNSFDDNGLIQKEELSSISLDHSLRKDTLNQLASRYFQSHLFINEDRKTVRLDQNLLSISEIRKEDFNKHTFILIPFSNGEVNIKQIQLRK
ncbi:TPA: hypothetical protein ACVU4H_001230 [Vibrio parahaemolyticus]